MKNFHTQFFFLLFLILMSCSKVSTDTSHSYNEAYFLEHDRLYYKSTDSVLKPDVFVPCDKEPQVNIKKLTKLLKYPEGALENDIEGEVVIRVLIDIDGSLKKYYIVRSSNDIFNIYAINAIKKYGKFIPAIYKGKPIVCWMYFPMAFRIIR